MQSLVSRIMSSNAAYRKVSPEEVAQIRERLPRGQKNQALANRFSQRSTARRLGISIGSVTKILSEYSQFSKRIIKRPRDMDNPVTRFLTMRTPVQEKTHEAA